MSKLKKVLAMLMAVVMTLGMGVMTFAAQVTKPTNTITVSNLAADVTTTVDLINIIYYDVTTTDGVETQKWVVQDWAKDYVQLDEVTSAYKITNPTALKEAIISRVSEDSDYYDDNVTGTTKKWENVPLGAYAIYANDTKGVYGLMVANTYDNVNQTYLASKPANVTAKMDSYKIDKTASDAFVHRGEEVTFTVTTQLPARTNEVIVGGELVKKTLTQFEIEDKPEGLRIDSITSAKIGNDPITITTDMITPTIDETTGETTSYKINLMSFMNETVEGSYKYESGETVVIVYKATVINDEDYNNNVDVNCNTVDYDNDSTEGFEANITVTKVDGNGEFLTGAEFQVIKNNVALWFVKTADGVYKRALNEEEEGAIQTLVVNTTNGTLKVTGLDEGTYTFKETKAPEGYSGGATKDVIVTAENQQVTIPASEDTNIVNTKLSSLPATGGMGTTIFTIGGCVIMIVAAGLYFATRKKVEK